MAPPIPQAYYELIDDADPRGERFHATDLVRSTWSAAIQHAAPVSALLVRALQHCAPRDDTRLSRVAIDLLGPIPVDGELWVRSHVQRPGRQIELIGAEMITVGPDGQPRTAARAGGWRFQRIDTQAVVHIPVAPLPPLQQARSRDLAANWDRNYVHSLDWRWLTIPQADGPGESWAKPLVDLVADEAMTPMQRLFTVADIANGVGSKLDIRTWTFLNTDLAVHIYREPEGEWTGVRAEANYGPDGIGATIGTLFDQRGPIAGIQQSILLRPRPL